MRRTVQRLRVLVVEPAGLLWGSERALLDLLSHLDKSRYDVTVVCPKDSPFLERVRRLNFCVMEAPLQLLHLRGHRARLHALVALTAIMIRIRPHVVHVNQAGVARLVSLASGIVGSRVLCHVRLFEDARRLSEGEAEWPRPHRLVAISNAILFALTRSEPNNRTPIDRVYDPLDGQEFCRLAEKASGPAIRAELGIPESAVVVSLVGRVCEEKRQATLIDAALIGRDDIFYLIIGGDPPPRAGKRVYRECLQERVQNSTLAGRVVFTGMRDDVAALLLASNIVVLTSDEEPLGRVLLEALSLKRHIVAPTSGGAHEIVGNDERGLSFAAGDANALAACISAIITDEATARSRTERGVKWIESVCSPTRHAREIEKIYDELGASVNR